MKSSFFLLFLVISTASFGQDWVEIVKEKLQVSKITPTVEKILYGKKVFDETPIYIGPKGSVSQTTGNEMTCKNCHLDSGMRRYGLQVTDSHGRYPRYRSREGSILSLSDRINSCIRMPMLGKPLDDKSDEMAALLLYTRFLGADRTIHLDDLDDRLIPIKFPKVAADPKNGKALLKKHCIRCHGVDGQGQRSENPKLYKYPPLWGKNSYRAGSSMHRNIVLARFIKANMPFDKATKDTPFLSDKESFDIAAYINDERINKRPSVPKTLYPNIEFKPIDYPYGPYIDHFSEEQHRYGPFEPIEKYYKERNRKGNFSAGDLTAP